MTVEQIREEMKRRNISVRDIQIRSGYSASFTSSIMNRMRLDSSGLPVAIRRTLESYGILRAEQCPPSQRQLDALKRFGCTEAPKSKDEASSILDGLIAEKTGQSYAGY